MPPVTVIMAMVTSVMVFATRRSFFSSPAPKKRLISTDAPIVSPLTPSTAMVMTGLAALTAATAASPAYRPITTESTALYSS